MDQWDRLVSLWIDSNGQHLTSVTLQCRILGEEQPFSISGAVSIRYSHKKQTLIPISQHTQKQKIDYNPNCEN